MVMSTEKKELLYGYSFYQAYLKGKLTKKLTLENIDGFAKDLIKKGFTEDDIKEIKAGIVEPKDFYKAKGNKQNMEWVFYALISVVFFSGMTLLFKKVTVLKVETPVLLMFIFGFGFLFYAIHVFANKTPVNVNALSITLLLVAAALSYGANFFSVKALGLAPNPGFSEAVGGLKLVVISLAAVALFGSQLTMPNIAGIVLMMAGSILLTVKF